MDAKPILSQISARVTPLPADTVVARYRFSESEFLTANRLHIELKRASMPRLVRIPRTWMPTIQVVAFIIGLAVCFFREIRYLGVAVIALVIFGFLLENVALPALVRFRFRRMPVRNAEYEWRISRDALLATTPKAKSEFSWEIIMKAGVFDEGLLLYPNHLTFFWLPKFAFASDDDFAKVVEWTKQNVERTKVIE